MFLDKVVSLLRDSLFALLTRNLCGDGVFEKCQPI